MAVSHRLIAVFALLWCVVAQAAIAPSPGYYYRDAGGPQVGPFATGALACQASRGAESVNWRAQSDNGANGTGVCLNGPGYAQNVNWDRLTGAMCPANSTKVGSNCNCNSGYIEQAGACVVDPNATHCASIAGSPVKSSWTSNDPSLSSRTICMTNAGYSCTATIEGDICGQGREGGPYLCHGSGVSGGAVCTPSPEPAEPPAPGVPTTDWPDAPAPGMCPGQVNGVDVVVPCSKTNTSGTKTEQSNDGAGNTTNKVESKATTCNAAGSCTTTVTTTTTVNGGTPKTTTSSTTQGKGEFCAGNPGAKECGAGDGSSFGGNCEASFVCTGDAVQCATAKAVNDSYCKFKEVFDMDPEIKAFAEGIMAGTEDPNPRDNPTVINLGTFDQSNPLSSACPADIPVNLSFFSTVIPLSEHCGALQMLGNMLVIFSLLGATIFVLRGGS